MWAAQEILPGLWRWSAPHPDWRPARPGSADDWEQMVGSVLFEPADSVAVIDPLIPRQDEEEFLAWLDRRVGDRPVSVLTTVRWHRRDREAVAARYRRQTRHAWNAVPAGVVPMALRGAGEIVYWLPDAATLVPGDRILGDGSGGLRLPPESWLGRVRVDRRGLADLLRPLLELPFERVLVSHGEPVLECARAALERAIAEASRS